MKKKARALVGVKDSFFVNTRTVLYAIFQHLTVSDTKNQVTKQFENNHSIS